MENVGCPYSEFKMLHEVKFPDVPVVEEMIIVVPVGQETNLDDIVVPEEEVKIPDALVILEGEEKILDGPGPDLLMQEEESLGVHMGRRRLIF